MPQISVPVVILLKTITHKIYTKKGCRLWNPLVAPDQRTCCHFAQNNYPRNLHKKVSFMTPLGMPQINVPVAILLKTITHEIYTKKDVVYGTPWDAPDQRKCCHFAQNMHKSEGI
jgi:hypothetical protein